MRHIGQAPMWMWLITLGTLVIAAAPGASPGNIAGTGGQVGVGSVRGVTLRPAAVFGSDNRIPKSRGPGSRYAAIGALANESLHERLWAQGSAFLVSACHVLTAAHNVVGTPALGIVTGYREDPAKLDALKLTFLIGQGDDSPFETWIPARVRAMGNFTPGSAVTSEDWALLELAECAGNRYGVIRLAELALDAVQAAPREIISAGYPADRDYRAGVWIEEGCTITGRMTDAPAALWGHDCAASPGMSGGPLMVDGRDALYAVAMHKNAATGAYPAFDPALANGALPVRSFLDRIRSYVCPCAVPPVPPGGPPMDASAVVRPLAR